MQSEMKLHPIVARFRSL